MEVSVEPAAKILKNDTSLSSIDREMSTYNGKEIAANEMTSKDYYFDSYAHFGN
jgi:hypothetical protein